MPMGDASISFTWDGAEIQGGKDPWFGLELWFLTSFQGKPVWALNREHLAYLIDYRSADLREKPSGSQKKTQADVYKRQVYISRGRWKPD